MEEIANKMKVLKLQDEKTILMKREVDIEDQICDLQDRLDLVMSEKSDLDRNNREIDEKIEAFNKEYEVFKSKQKDIISKVQNISWLQFYWSVFVLWLLQDFNIEKKYKLLQQEMDKLGLERKHICEKNEELKTKIISVSQQFKLIEDQKSKLVLEDQRIEDECQAIHKQFEKLRNGKLNKFNDWLILTITFPENM